MYLNLYKTEYFHGFILSTKMKTRSPSISQGQIDLISYNPTGFTGKLYCSLKPYQHVGSDAPKHLHMNPTAGETTMNLP